MADDTPGGIPWSRILVEGVVIVVSILLAFAIDAAWDARQDRAAVRAALVDLRAELRESLPLIDATLDQIDTDLGLLRGTLADPAQVVAKLDSLTYGDVVEAIVRPNTADDNSTAIEAVLDDPRVGDMDDDGIRSAAALWRQHREEIRERGSTIVSAEPETFRRLAEIPDVQRGFAGYRAPRGGASPEAREWTHAISASTVVGLSGTPEIRALMARKAILAESQRGWTLSLRDATETLIAEVERALVEM